MDHLFIEDFRLEARVGIYPREQAVRQMITLNIEIGLPKKYKREDQISETIDYATVISTIRVALENQHFNLIEGLAEHIAEILLNEFSAPWVRIAASKLGIIRGVRQIGVIIERNTKMSSM